MSNNTSNDQALQVTTNRNAHLLQLRDQMEVGAHRPGAIIPSTFAEAQAMCAAIAISDLVPKRYKDKPQDMIVVVMSGSEVGMPPMAALRLYHVIEGVPRLSAEGLRAVVLAHPSCEFLEPREMSETRCTWAAKRRGRPEVTATWSIERARRALLADKDMWRKYPEDQMNARASAQLCRLIWPEICAGMITREEALDGDYIDAEFSDKPTFVAPPAKAIAAADPADKKPVEQAKGRAEAADPKPRGERASRSSPPASSRQSASTESASSSTPSKTSSSDAAPADDLPPGAKLDAAIADVARKALERAADPTPSTGASSPSTESVPATAETTSSGVSPAADDFGAEDPVDREPEHTREGFTAWLRKARSVAELDATKGPWMAWSRSAKNPDGTLMFPPGSPAQRDLQGEYAARKAELP